MTEWWSQLALEFQIFYAVGIVATFILVIQLTLSLFGLGDDAMDAAGGGDMDFGSADADFDVDSDSGGLQVISVRTVIAFMAGFGWTGVVGLRNGLSMTWSLMIAVAVGTVLMWGVYMLMRGLYGLRQSGSLDYRNAIGELGSVYIRIPAAGHGEGQVELMVQGRLRTVQACTEAQQELVSGTKVRVVNLIPPRTLVVETFNSSTK